MRPLVALFVSALLMSPAGLAQGVTQDRYAVPQPPGNLLLRHYRQAEVAPVNLQNSNRLDSLLRGGKIYLSLEDCIAIALENNLDIELSRYTPQLAQVDLMRAQSGGLLRGVPTAVRASANSVQSQVTGGATGGAGGGASAVQGGAGGDSGGVGGAVITQTGVAIPTLDGTFFSSATMGHRSSPQSNTITTGTTALAFDSRQLNLGYQQNFLTGTSFTYVWNNSYFSSNNRNSQINPGWNPNMQLQISQKLLQGFGLAVNNRNIRVAKNNIRVGDLTFKQQVMTTVAGVVNLYWDLVSFNEDLKVKRKALEVAEKFYSDNKKQVEIGTLAPIEIVRAEARVAQAQQDLTNSETALLQQETIIKNALSRTGVSSPSLAEARVAPTDTLAQPGNDQLDKLKDAIELALQSRPDLEQTRINLESNRIAVSGSKSQLLPSLDVQASFQNNSLAGSVNSLLPPGAASADAFFLGGYGTALSQIFRRNFPDYSIGFNLSIPVRNRTAQADYVRDQISIRQAELNQQRQINDIRVNVQNALIAVIQAKARYESAVKERRLQVQTLDAENKKYALGASTAFQVVSTQRDLAQAQSGEVSALANYSRARVQLDLQTAQILTKYKVEIAEAKAGKSSRPIQAQPN
ncbi:MAG: TolC family protein [Candidatus Solibacter usitatus]|nr:TolC family protein [Candidatus Solibacter usitatus]